MPPEQRSRFDDLYRRWYRPVVRLCRLQLGPGHDAEAVAQEAFIRAWRSWLTYADDRPFGPWVTAIARRLCTSESRRSARRQSILGHGDAALRPPQDDGLETALRSTGIDTALRALSPRARRLVFLRDVEARPYEEIARIDGSSVDAVRWATKRARAAFRAAFEQVAGMPVAIGTGGRSCWLRLRRFFEGLSSRVSSLEPAAAAAVLLLAPAAPMVQPAAESVVAVADSGAAPALHNVEAKATVDSVVPSPLFDSSRPTDALAALEAAVDIVDVVSDGRRYKFTVSPNYREDRTVFAYGQTERCVRWACAVLLRSTDGGETWTRLRAAGLLAGEGSLLLPPEYPRDDRIFVQAGGADTLTYNLAVSRDGGDSFQPLASAALGTPMAMSISPRFAAGDPRILLTATEEEVAVVYRHDTGRVEPLQLPLPIGVLPRHVVFGHSYEQDGATVVSAPHFVGRWRVFRCTPNACASALEVPTSKPLRLAGGPLGTVLAWTEASLYRSTDDGRSFQPAALPENLTNRGPLDVLADQRGSIFLRVRYVSPTEAPLFVSHDLGQSWTQLAVPDRNYLYRLAVLPDGVLLASLHSSQRSFACSVDGGVTWESRCRRAA